MTKEEARQFAINIQLALDAERNKYEALVMQGRNPYEHGKRTDEDVITQVLLGEKSS